MSVRHTMAFAALLSLFLAVARPCAAWDATGHMVVAEIAWRNLTPATRIKVTELLSHSVSYNAWIAQMPAGYPDRDLYVFMRAATWPDDIRSTHASRPAWHYIDEPVVFGQPAIPNFTAPPADSSQCRDGNR